MRAVRIVLGFLCFGLAANAQVTNPAPVDDDFYQKGQYAEAISVFEKLPAAQQTAAVLNHLAVSYYILNRLPQAEATYLRAIKVDGAYAAAYNNLGALYYAQRKFSDADNQFRKAAERDSQNTVVRENLRASRYARDNTAAARARADEIAKVKVPLTEAMRGNYWSVRSLLPASVVDETLDREKRGDAFSARKAYEDAVIEYKKVLALDRYNASVMNKLGIAYHQLQRSKEAEQQYRDVLRLNPYFLEALNNLGVVEFTKRDYSSALDQYTKALKLQPQSATTLHNMATCLFAMERFEEGARALEQALTINPRLFDRPAGGPASMVKLTEQGNMLMNFQLAKIFAGQGDKDLAISYLNKAVEGGFRDVKKVKAEPVFKILEFDERFDRILQTMTQGPSA